MTWTDLRLRMKALIFRQRAECELDEELSSHIEMQTEHLIRRGMAREDARRSAHAAFGGASQIAEQCRDERGTRWLDDIGRDLTYAARQMLKHHGFFAVSAITLALAIGANTAIFSAVHGVLLRPYPYHHPDRLVSIWCTEASRGVPQMGCALPDLQAIAARNHSFEMVASYYGRDVNITGGTPERVTGVSASANLFPLLGVNAAVGRTFLESEEVFGRHQVVILSDALWQRRFGGDLNVIGSNVRLNGELYTVIGVMPPAFRFPHDGFQLWVPLSFASNDAMATRNNHFINALVRLKPGVSVTKAREDMQAIARQLAGEFSENAGVGVDLSDYASSVVGNVRPVLLVLLGAVGIVLLIACVNVANLLLSRASGRQRELAVRTALGASRARLVRQLLGEGVLLGGVGACLGVALSSWLVHLIRTLGPRNIPRLRSIEIEGPVLAFTVGLTALSVLLFALTPALSMVRVQVSEALKEGGRTLTSGGRSGRLRDALVIAQVTLSLVLVIGAGLLFQTLWRLQHVDPGFRAANVLTLSVSLPAAKYPNAEPAKAARFFDDLTQQLARTPGVSAVGASTALPIANWGGWGKYFTIDDQPASRLADVPIIQFRQVTADYARSLNIPVIEGRFFTGDDTANRPLVAVINESARRRFFPNVNPIGKLVFPGAPESTVAEQLPSPDFRIPRLRIIGVIGDVKHSGLAQSPQPELYVPHLQGTAKDIETPSTKMFVMIKTPGDPLQFAPIARRIVQSIDPEQPVADIASMEQLLQSSLSTQRFQLFLFGAFAAVALALAAVGVYGVMSYSVRLKQQEIGVRMALGARSADVVRMMVGRGLGLGLAGVLAGTVLGLTATRLMSALLFGVKPHDGFTFLIAGLVLMLVVFAATLGPSLQAARTDPMTVLRAE